MAGATIRETVSATRPGRYTEMDGKLSEISEHNIWLTLPNSAYKSIKSPYIGSAPAGLIKSETNIH